MYVDLHVKNPLFFAGFN